MRSSKSGEREIWPFQSTSITTNILSITFMCVVVSKGTLWDPEVYCSQWSVLRTPLLRPELVMHAHDGGGGHLPRWGTATCALELQLDGGSPTVPVSLPSSLWRTRRGLCPCLIRLDISSGAGGELLHIPRHLAERSSAVSASHTPCNTMLCSVGTVLVFMELKPRRTSLGE